jgi:hypothetical protein
MMNENEQGEAWEQLFKKGPAFDVNTLASTILPYAAIHIQEDRYEIEFSDRWDDLTVKKKLLIWLLLRKAIFLKDESLLQVEDTTPAQIEEDTGLKGNSIRPILRQLLDERLVQSDEGVYKIPNREVRKISEMFTKKGDKE